MRLLSRRELDFSHSVSANKTLGAEGWDMLRIGEGDVPQK